jgi:hypothetical protein
MLRSAPHLRRGVSADPGAILLRVGRGSREQRDRMMLRIAGRTLHRVRDTMPQDEEVCACSSAFAIARRSCHVMRL